MGGFDLGESRMRREVFRTSPIEPLAKLTLVMDVVFDIARVRNL
jgi:hypothetical protein